MGFPGYYVSDPDDFTLFTVKERYGSDPKSVEELDIVHETDAGHRFVFKQGSRELRRLVFRVTASQLTQFRALHDLVGGQETSFFFIEDSDTMIALHVRKEKDFRPVELDREAVVDGSAGAMYDYTLELTEEPGPGSFGQ